MRIAIPVSEGSMAHRFESASNLLLLTVGQAEMCGTATEPLEGLSPRKRRDLLLRSDVDVVLCRGIRRADSDLLHAAGIRVFSGRYDLMAASNEPSVQH